MAKLNNKIQVEPPGRMLEEMLEEILKKATKVPGQINDFRQLITDHPEVTKIWSTHKKPFPTDKELKDIASILQDFYKQVATNPTNLKQNVDFFIEDASKKKKLHADTKAGDDFEIDVTNDFKKYFQPSPSNEIQQLYSSLNEQMIILGKQLDEYHFFDQVLLTGIKSGTTNSTIPDVLLVKYDSNKIIVDAVFVEIKINKGDHLLSKYQKQCFATSSQGNSVQVQNKNDFKFSFKDGEISLKKGESVPITAAIRIFGDNSSPPNLQMEIIDMSKFIK